MDLWIQNAIIFFGCGLITYLVNWTFQRKYYTVYKEILLECTDRINKMEIEIHRLRNGK
jgi:hypothetical protein